MRSFIFLPTYAVHYGKDTQECRIKIPFSVLFYLLSHFSPIEYPHKFLRSKRGNKKRNSTKWKRTFLPNSRKLYQFWSRATWGLDDKTCHQLVSQLSPKLWVPIPGAMTGQIYAAISWMRIAFYDFWCFLVSFRSVILHFWSQVLESGNE